MSEDQRSLRDEKDDVPVSRPAARAEDAVARLLSEPLAPGLYLVATPIGNLGDITLRALSVLARADIIYCEDTRHSGRLLQHYSITARTRPFHEHNEDREIERAIADLESGKRIAIISDAGTPLLSDPGFKLVRAAAAAGISIVPIPGASALLAALDGERPTDGYLLLCRFSAAQAGGAPGATCGIIANTRKSRFL